MDQHIPVLVLLQDKPCLVSAVQVPLRTVKNVTGKEHVHDKDYSFV